MVTFRGIDNELMAMREQIEMGNMPDAYEMAKFIDLIAIDVAEAATDAARTEQDLRDECREAYGWQEQYMEQLEHAERHIEWLEDEFSDEIVECDKYERAC